MEASSMISRSLEDIIDVNVESAEQAKEVLEVLLANAPQWAIFCGNIAPIVTIILRLSPVPTVRKFVERGSVGSLPLMPYTALLTDSILWLLYGILVTDMNIILCQIFGVLFALTYSFFYARTYQKSGNREDLTILPGTLAQHGFFIIFILFAYIAIIFIMPYNQAKEIIGFGADGGSIFMYIGPMAAVRAVIKEKNAASLPLPFTVMCFLNGFCWFAYGWFVLRDIILWGPSIIGVILSTIQMVLICYYGSRQEIGDEGNMEMKNIKLSKSDHGDSDNEETTVEVDDEEADLERLIKHSDDS